MTKHTPGPWKAVPCGGTSAVVAPTGMPSQLMYGYHGYAIGQPSMIGGSIYEAERPDIAAHFRHADACLIAAAPDMLAALKLAHSFCGDTGLSVNDHPMDQINQAIEKAEGIS